MDDTIQVKPTDQTNSAAPVVPMRNRKTGRTIAIVLGVLLLLCLLCTIGTIFLLSRLSGPFQNELRRIENDVRSQIDGVTPTPTNTLTPTPTSTSGNEAPFASAELPANFPKDFPIYTGAKPTLSQNISENGQVAVNFEADVAMQKVVDYFKTELPKQGWKIDQELTLFGHSMAVSKEGRNGTLVVLGDDTTTSYIVSVDPTK